MKKIFLLLVFSIILANCFAQDLKNPRLVSSYGGSTYSSGNYLLTVDPASYIQKSRIDIRDLENLLDDWRDKKSKITEQENKLNEQKREIDELKRTVNQLTRKLSDLERKVK